MTTRTKNNHGDSDEPGQVRDRSMNEQHLDESYTILPSDDEVDPQEADDYALAVALQEKLNTKSPQRRDAAGDTEQDMNSSNTGKALSFAQQIIANHERVTETFQILGYSVDLIAKFKLVSADDIVCLTERLLRRQELFARDQKDTLIDVGYRFTDSDGMSRIRTDGLQSDGTSDLGAGIYSANNPFAATGTGDGGDKLLLIARLKGLVDNSGDARGKNQNTKTFDTVVDRAGATNEVCVLNRASQCVPLLLVDTALVDITNDASDGNNMVHIYHCHLQNVLDSCFNAGKEKTNVVKVLPSQVTIRKLRAPSIPSHISLRPILPIPTLHSVLYYTAPEYVRNGFRTLPTENDLQRQIGIEPAPGSNCQACGKALRGPNAAGRLPACKHEFHIKCFLKRLKRNPDACPACSTDIGQLPRGLMRIDADSKPTTLVVDSAVDHRQAKLSAPSEVQKRHCNPLDSYVTIVPPRSSFDVPRFSFAYTCGSTFDVSLALGEDGQSISDVWSSMFASTTFVERIQKRVQEHAKKCSTCRKMFVRKPRTKIFVGGMPTGIMRVDELPELVCSGHEAGAFLISYRFESGLQKDYHINPGELFGETYHEAYLPSNKEGRDLLKRLKYAFSRGLTFNVSMSTTNTEKENTIEWAIPHKTSLKPGTFGFPDHRFIAVANKELDSLEVPPANKL